MTKWWQNRATIKATSAKYKYIVHLLHLRHPLDVYQTDQGVKEDLNYWTQQNLEPDGRSYSLTIPKREVSKTKN